MQDISETEIRTEIIKALGSMTPDRPPDAAAIGTDQDLLEFVDSFGFVQLLMAIEEPLGLRLDLTAVDLGAIVRLNNLVAFVLQTSIARPTDRRAEAG